MENLLHNKWLLYGGAAVLAIGAGYWYFSNAAASAAPASAPDTSSMYSSIPYTYNSGTGTPVDTTGNTDLSGSTGNSSIDYLNALAQIAAVSGAGSTNASAAELSLQQTLGQKSIQANEDIALANVGATQNATLAQLAGTLSQTITGTGIAEQQIQATAGNQSVTVTGVSIANNSKYNKVLAGANGIVLPSGQILGKQAG